MGKQYLLIGNSEQSMNQTTVPDKNLGRPYQAFSEIGMPGLQTPYKEKIDQQIGIIADCFYVDTKISGKLRHIEKLPLMPCQHRPEPAKRFSRNSRAELRNLTFKICSDKVLPPAQTACCTGSKKTVWKTAANPQLIELQFSSFKYGKRSQFKV